MATGNHNCKIICAICYEEAKPGSEDLQSISLCGHVFHELCLQQWLEYHPAGRKASCPLCKHQCSEKDIHRLYFQSASETTQLTQGKISEALNTCDDVKTLQDTIQKLNGQLSVTKSALDASQKQLQDLNQQVSICTVRAAQAESAQIEARKEQLSSNDALSRIREELNRCTMERCKLLDKNTVLMKEIASAKLVQNLDVDEEDVARMAQIGRGNKDDIIGTLTRSLIIRNRAYKDLMAKCNELGICESKASRKAEKAVERIKLLKARVQELERNLEDKENNDLRQLKSSCFQGNSLDLSDDKHLSIKNLSKGLYDTKPPIHLQPMSQMMVNSTRAKISNDSISEDEDLFTFREPGKGEQKECEKLKEVQNRPRTDTLGVGIIIEEIEERLGPEVKSACQNMVDGETYSNNLKKSHVPVTIKKEVRLTAGTTCMMTSKLDCFAPKTSNWCKQATTTDGETPKGTFISFGANGRGGQVKVLRPPAPMLKFSRVSSDVGLRPAKRMKPARNGLSGAALQIEHFFSGSR